MPGKVKFLLRRVCRVLASRVKGTAEHDKQTLCGVMTSCFGRSLPKDKRWQASNLSRSIVKDDTSDLITS
jgi:hypothetical protein